MGTDSSSARTLSGEAVASVLAICGNASAASVRSLLAPGLLIASLKLLTTGVAVVPSGCSLDTNDESNGAAGLPASTSLVRSASVVGSVSNVRLPSLNVGGSAFQPAGRVGCW